MIGHSLIRDEQVFETNYLPNSLPHRHDALLQLSRGLQPATTREKANHIIISGSSGIGKTVLARFLIENLHREHGVPYTYIRCTGRKNAALVHQAIIDHPNEAIIQPNAALDRQITVFEHIVDKPYVIILDEADTIPRMSLLESVLSIPLVSVVAITHDAQIVLNRLSSTVQKQFGVENHIHLNPYTTAELATILDKRAEIGLVPGAISNAGLQQLANGVDGVARYGIYALHESSRIAIEKCHRRITEEDILESFDRSRRRMRSDNLRSLSFGHHFIYEIIRTRGRINSEQLYREYDLRAPLIYRERDDQRVGKRRIRDYLSKLISYDLVEKENTNRWAIYQVSDGNVLSDINLPGFVSERN